ncbi:MAG: flagellar hook-associated protein FlgL [Elusimicrobia bacterium]|jgi:flagellar hook-associated protein 3 FlgL|nr:flagellar hook-associated protein FlgL [Elusimicrobiota bacterium]
MRITDKIIQRGMVDDIHRQLDSMNRLQRQISSGQKVHNLSDDPARAARSVGLNAAHTALVQHRKTAEDGVTWMSATLGSLATARESIQTARVMAIQGANDTLSLESRQVLALSVQGIASQLLETANTKWNGASLFAGNKTTTPAFTSAAVYQGDTGTMVRDISPGETSVVNLTGKQVFVDGENAFQVLTDLQTALTNNDSNAINALLPRLDNALNQMLKLEATLGAEVQRVETTTRRLDDLEVNLMKRISNNDDTDMPQALVDLQNANTLYEAALKASASLFKSSLLDYLR